MESQNGSLEDDIPFQTGEAQVPCVSFQGDVVTKENITLLKGDFLIACFALDI